MKGHSVRALMELHAVLSIQVHEFSKEMSGMEYSAPGREAIYRAKDILDDAIVRVVDVISDEMIAD